MRLGIRDFDRFIDGPFQKKLFKAYTKYKILSEADLQSRSWMLIRDFLKRRDPGGKRFRILNQPRFKLPRNKVRSPDIVVFERYRPWVLIELKEVKRLTPVPAKRAMKRLPKLCRRLKPHGSVQRAYLAYVARWGMHRVLRGPKGRWARCFFEVPITLERHWRRSTPKLRQQRIQNWEQERRKLQHRLGLRR
jgi:hypothetical protein